MIFPVGEDQLPGDSAKDSRRPEADGGGLGSCAEEQDRRRHIWRPSISEIDQTTGTLKLRAIFFNNENRALFPNQFVNARLLQQEKTGVTLLPSAAIQRNTNNTYVYLVKPDFYQNTVTIRNIKVGTTEGDQTEVTSGLSPGDKVMVMTGVDKLQEGSQ